MFNRKNPRPARTRRELATLEPAALARVTGGRKAGGEQQEYLIITMNEILVSS
jgi:hypothetical protein